ncbi:MAG: glycine cleavage system aminomethyltransferase GcvT [Planctomycetes bacterium]|nr:glycine cleavage system aminomethyltransferase GcvT [Planctomycetota bacterium]
MHPTPLIEFHRRNGARLVEFAGWEMPVVYTGIIEEHHWTRRHASVFDVSHMGRVEFRGSGAEAFLEHACKRRIGDMKTGQSRYSHACREDGGILDDIIVSRFEDHFMVVCNASNREKMLAWWGRQKRGFDVEITDRTFETAMVAIQGPEAIETIDKLLPFPVGDLKRYHFKTGSVVGASYTIARSGYTGEDGVEIILPANFADAAMTMLGSASEQAGRPVKPAGLGARDTLRLEAAMPLYGHELTEDWDPISGGQAWCVDLTKNFIGQPAIHRVKESGPRRVIDESPGRAPPCSSTAPKWAQSPAARRARLSKK